MSTCSWLPASAGDRSSRRWCSSASADRAGSSVSTALHPARKLGGSIGLCRTKLIARDSFNTNQVRAFETRGAKVCLGDVRVAQVRIVQLRALEVRVVQLRAGEVRSGEIGPGERSPREVDVGQVGSREIGFGEIAPAQVGAGQVGSGEIRLAQGGAL